MLSNIITNHTEETGEKRGLSGSSLKLIAIITMFIDHVGAALLLRLLLAHPFLADRIAWEGFWDLFPWVADRAQLYSVYLAMRQIGRVAFPIFCFLLVEGFRKTRSVKKYALRLGIFAIASEIPFDLAINGVWMEFSHQNVFFTLFLGLLTMAAWDFILRKQWFSNKGWNNLVKSLLIFASGLGVACLADFLQTDYGSRGIMCILALYIFSKYKIIQAAAGAISFSWEWPAPLAFLPILFYSGKRGMRVKYAFYLFYPLHLLLLYLVCEWLGLGNAPIY